MTNSPSAGHSSADVLVIGGGINGVCTAYHLSRAGVKVTLLEKNAIGSGPTGRSCGIIRQHYSHHVTARMAKQCLEVFENFDERVGGHCDFRKTGALVTAPVEMVESLRSNVELQRSVGIETSMIDLVELAELEPDLDLDGIAAAAWEPDAGYADPYSTAHAYARRAADFGARILTGVEVESMTHANGRATGVVTDHGSFSAGATVLALGPWSRKMVSDCGFELPLTAGRVQVGLFRSPPEHTRHHILLDTVRGFYVRPEAGSMMVVGSLETGDADTSIEDPDSFRESIDYGTVVHYTERLVDRYPAMVEAGYANGYASLYDISPDWQPIVDRVPALDHLYCVAGSSGHGFKLAPAIGEIAAHLVLGEPSDQQETEMFSLDRFRSRRLSPGKYQQNILG